MGWHTKESLTIMTIATATTAACMTVFMGVLCICVVYRRRQKTRTPPQRRMYVGSRVRQSLSQAEPTIYVSPNNLPPPPKYECLAPPSYEEVVGIHYPQYQNQPITQPITVAMAQNTQPSQNVTDAPPAPTVITVTSERTSVQVAASSS
ncbi:uncharacterized protein LOC134678787 isoform X5 [Cydia fagiglandana]|uniref:uncharacterized protein LOC134678787 isoform X5 n=1 Tax=Cydia fagiglandana TaxID=1458189 RepID=UPI002FEE060F